MCVSEFLASRARKWSLPFYGVAAIFLVLSFVVHTHTHTQIHTTTLNATWTNWIWSKIKMNRIRTHEKQERIALMKIVRTLQILWREEQFLINDIVRWLGVLTNFMSWNQKRVSPIIVSALVARSKPLRHNWSCCEPKKRADLRKSERPPSS